MGLFSKKNKMQEEKLKALQNENMKLRARLDAVKEKESFIEKTIKENEDLKKELQEYTFSKEKSAKAMLEAQQAVDELKSTALYKYLLEIKTLKNYRKKLEDFLSSSEPVSKKCEIIDLLADLFDEVDDKNAKEKVEKAVEILDNGKREETCSCELESEFNLDEALNPDVEMTLEELCKELGVFKG